MYTELKQTVTVQRGGLIQVWSPEFYAGLQAEVTIKLDSLPVDESDEWSEEDLRDFTNAGEFLISYRLEEEENAATR